VLYERKRLVEMIEAPPGPPCCIRLKPDIVVAVDLVQNFELSSVITGAPLVEEN
jgi:hypothetical protein